MTLKRCLAAVAGAATIGLAGAAADEPAVEKKADKDDVTYETCVNEKRAITGSRIKRSGTRSLTAPVYVYDGQDGRMRGATSAGEILSLAPARGYEARRKSECREKAEESDDTSS